MGFSGGSVSFSGSGGSYSVSYSAPSYTPDPGWSTVRGVQVSVPGPSTVGYSTTATQGYDVVVYSSLYGTETYDTTISGTSPSAPVSYPPSWSDNTLAGFQATVAYSDGVSATNMGYSGSYSVVSGSLPTGITLNGSSGAVTGTPTTAGQSYSFTLRASNSYGSTDASFSGTVAVAPTAGKWRVWTGSTWVVGPLKVWNGTAWVDSSVKVWNGTAWVTSV